MKLQKPTTELFVLRDEQTQFFPRIHLESEKKLFWAHQARGSQYFFNEYIHMIPFKNEGLGSKTFDEFDSYR